MATNPLTTHIHALAAVLSTLDACLSDHGPSCPCPHCYNRQRGDAALECLGLLCTLVEEGAQEETTRNRYGSYNDLLNAVAKEQAHA